MAAIKCKHTDSQHKDGPEIDVQHHVVGPSLEAVPHVVLGHPCQTVQHQGADLEHTGGAEGTAQSRRIRGGLTSGTRAREIFSGLALAGREGKKKGRNAWGDGLSESHQQHFPEAEDVVSSAGAALLGLVEKERHTADDQQHAQVLGQRVLLPQDGDAQDHHCTVWGKGGERVRLRMHAEERERVCVCNKIRRAFITLVMERKLQAVFSVKRDGEPLRGSFALMKGIRQQKWEK